MMLSTILMAGQTVSSAIQAGQQSKSAKNIGKIQKQMAKDDLMYNKSQLYDYYDKTMMNSFTQYAQARADKAQEYQSMASELNTMVSSQGVNLASSSVKDDVNNQLDFEYETGLQNLMTNQMNDLSTIAANVAAQDYQIQKQYNDSIHNINSAVQQTENAAWDKVFQNLGNTLVSVAGGIDATHSSNKLLNPSQSLSSSIGDYFTSFTGFTSGVR